MNTRAIRFAAPIAFVAIATANVALASVPFPEGLTPRLVQPLPTVDTKEAEMFRDRAFPRAVPPAGAHLAALEQRTRLDSGSLRWRALGPRAIGRTNYRPIYQGRGAFTGRVTAIANHPSDPATAYLGSAGGGVWKTTDGGKRWRPVFDEQPALNIGGLALDPARPSTLYAGTGEANAFYFSPPSVGLIKSTDAGRSWRVVAKEPFLNCYFGDLAVSPQKGVVYAAIGSGVIPQLSAAGPPPACQAPGLWRSDDGGETWTQALSGNMWDIAIDRSRPGVVYAGAGGVTSFQGGGLLGDGVFKSEDYGQTWLRLAGGLPVAGYSRAAIAVGPPETERVYAAFVRGDSDTLLGIWTSTNGGVAWTPIPIDRQPCTYNNGFVFEEVSQCTYDLALAADQKDESIVYAGGVVTVRYSDAGIDARLVGTGTGGIHVDQHVFTHDADRRMWVGNDGGIYRTSNQGRTWDNLNRTLALTQFYPGISGSLRTSLLGGSQDNGTSMYRGRARWTGVLGADGGFSAVNPKKPNVMYGTYQNLRIWKSTNAGWKWRFMTSGIGTESRAFIAPLVMDPVRPSTLYAGTTMVYRSKDGARTWSSITPALGGTVRAIGRTPAPSKAPVIWAGTSTGRVWVTRDGGQSWVEVGVPGGIPARVVTDFAFHPRRASIAYLTLGGYGTPHVYVTKNHGRSWMPITNGLPDAPINAIARDPRTGRLYAGGDVGLFSSPDEGGSWKLESRNLPNSMVMDLLLDPKAMKLVVATHGRGMFSARL